MRPGLPRLHIVSNDAVVRLPDLASRARSVAAAGPVALHARAPSAAGRALYELTQTIAQTSAVLIVNDRVDVAVAAGAAGVHLPARGLPIAAARRMIGPDRWIGRSTHHPDEARAAAEEGADYVFLGPIWETTSHRGRAALGLGAIAAAGRARVIAIGGITTERVSKCRAAGAYGVAVLSAVWEVTDPGSVVRRMMVSLAR